MNVIVDDVHTGTSEEFLQDIVTLWVDLFSNLPSNLSTRMSGKVKKEIW